MTRPGPPSDPRGPRVGVFAAIALVGLTMAGDAPVRTRHAWSRAQPTVRVLEARAPRLDAASRYARGPLALRDSLTAAPGLPARPGGTGVLRTDRA